ncbi:LysR family transcriptional regulator [Zongyangia hominis]|uniref:LysR family transcriptional regulator n=1 Tax=Zongyangia hominis TaxID=2763677 RepID=A0A926ECF7_9FIRM|nr:LysR family transcriptional regulator [Zongyangia hominis]MBC8569396.1 LysR family transcriptional regulator [Zongyangia hominis]
MIDLRLETFLDLCETRSYTRTAKHLHITQPAVSQHIKFLENQYGARLFSYRAKVLSLTEKGRLLEQYALALRANSQRMHEVMRAPSLADRRLHFGATLTVGEYVMPSILCRCLAENPKLSVTMEVGNTSTLFRKLNHGAIDFAIIEGSFSKVEYGWRLLSEEPFIGVCSPRSPLAGRPVRFDELVGQNLILREQGSGTRQALEHSLGTHSLQLENFPALYEIGNFQAIKAMVAENLGITFLYERVVRRELEVGQLQKIDLAGFQENREFHFVYLHDHVMKEEFLKFFTFCRTCLEE